MFTLRINFEDSSSSSVEINRVEPGQSLLEICISHGIPLRHKCGGMCFCSTCQVFVDQGREFLEPVSAREKHFIERAVKPRAISRLACQAVLLEETTGGVIKIVIPRQKGI